jgi:hypothetical protein
MLKKFSSRHPWHNILDNVTCYLVSSIESDTRPINFFKMPHHLKNSYIFGLDLENLAFVVTKWCQHVTMSKVVSLAFEKHVKSFYNSFCLG